MSFSPQDFCSKTTYTFDDLLDLVRFLRSPEGCEWDRAQTHASVRKNLLEEAYEVAEGIDRDDAAILREELGDFLFQAAFHMVIEEEQARSLPEDIMTAICLKMISRHPHLFSDSPTHLSENEVPVRWEEIKRKEKGQTSTAQAMQAIPKTLPALMYAQKTGEKAARAGFTYGGAAEAGEKVAEEWEELLAAKSKDEQREELGDMLFALVNYGRLLGIEAEEALMQATKKFASRFAALEENLAPRGGELAKCTKKELLLAWNEQKNKEKSTKIAKI